MPIDRFCGAQLLVIIACSLAVAAHATSPASVRLEPTAARAQTLPDELFGIAWNWLDGGGGVIEYGELVRDRSFRNQKSPNTRVWIESPNKAIAGKTEYLETGGDPQPVSGTGYPGYFRINQKENGYTCISQEIREGVSAGESYELHISSLAEQGTPALSVFLTDLSFNPIEELDNLSWVKPDGWQDYAFTLNPQTNVGSAYLRICLVAAGTVGVDEIRFRLLGSEPRIKADADQKIQQLGVRSLRWPTGSDADYFDWRGSIGPILQRGESPSAFGSQQTPSLGLHEFLNYCEQRNIVPLITVNIRDSPRDAAELVEYILGDATTTMGALRATNGRTAPWTMRHFELGNEPVDVYRGRFSAEDAARGYVETSTAIAAAMRARSKAIGRPITLQGVVDATFAIANWISAAPMLAKWNNAVLGDDSTLREHVDYIKGNFYSGFNYRSSASAMLRELMAGGATIQALVRSLEDQYGPQPPFWLTEYAVMVQKSKLLGGAEIQLDRSNDFQAGLVAADILMSAIDANFGGAYLFNLAARGTWGVLENKLDNHAQFDVGPAGLAFSMLSPLAGQKLVPVVITGAKTITLKKGDGATPSGTQYQTLGAVAAIEPSSLTLVVINRSYDETFALNIDLAEMNPSTATMELLASADLKAKNIDGAAAVAINRSTLTASQLKSIDIPPHSLLRIVYQRP